MHFAFLMLASGFAGWNIGYAIAWLTEPSSRSVPPASISAVLRDFPAFNSGGFSSTACAPKTFAALAGRAVALGSIRLLKGLRAHAATPAGVA